MDFADLLDLHDLYDLPDFADWLLLTLFDLPLLVDFFLVEEAAVSLVNLLIYKDILGLEDLDVCLVVDDYLSPPYTFNKESF